jgi:hypothetical protein
MASRKPPGIDPMGHPPFAKVKLEGPKKHHDDHGPNASVPAKGDARAIPGEHWEMQYTKTGTTGNKVMDLYNPICAKDRPTAHKKVNETDH